MASPNFSEIATTTIENRSKVLADNVSANNALLKRLKERSKSKTFSGGRTLVQELDYAENSTFQYYSGYEELNVNASNVLSAAEFEIKQAAVAVVLSGLEELQNAGPEQMIDLLEGRIENAERTMMNNISVGVYSDGTGSSSKQIGGLQLLVADAPSTGTVGGINRATYTFWQNKSYDMSDNSLTASSSTIQRGMNALYMQLVRGADRPDLIVADNTFFQYYLESLQAIQRITEEKTGQIGFMNLKYMGADVLLDGGYSGDAPSNHMYMLNTNYIFFRTHAKRNFAALNPDRQAVNQDAMVKLIAWAGNMTVSNCFLQGVLKA